MTTTLAAALSAATNDKRPRKVAHPSAATFRGIARMFGTCEIHAAIQNTGAAFVTNNYSALTFAPGTREAEDVARVLQEHATDRAQIRVRKTGDAFTVTAPGIALTADVIAKAFAPIADAREVIAWAPDAEGTVRGSLADGTEIRVNAAWLAALIGKRSGVIAHGTAPGRPVTLSDRTGATFAVIMPLAR